MRLRKNYNEFSSSISYLSSPPVQWHKTLKVPVTYQVGLPSKEFIMEQPKNSCLVIDDSFDKALQSPVIDHLFRVMSGKLSISVILMSQNTFSKGKFSRDIRNSCNFLALFRNCADTRINLNLARMVGLCQAYKSAQMELNGSMFPVMFLDLSQKGQLTPYRLYTDIFSKYQVVFSESGMKGYIINENDFETYFKVNLNSGISFEAEENENETPEISRNNREGKSKIDEKEKVSENEGKNEQEKNSESRPDEQNTKRRNHSNRFKRNQGTLQRWKRRSQFNLSKLTKRAKLFRKNQ